MEEEKTVSPFVTEQEKQEKVTDQMRQIIHSGESVVSQSEVAESVSVQVEYAGFWVRFAAMLVDGLVLMIPTVIIQIIFGKNLGGFLGYVLAWIYAIYMLNTRQSTLGKMALGLKVTSIDGEKTTVGKLALREIIGKSILNALTLGIGYLMIAFTAKKQGLHDMIADTVVVYDPARKRRGWIVVLGIVFALLIPIMGIIAGIVLVSTNSARQEALDTKLKQEQILKDVQMENQNRR